MTTDNWEEALREYIDTHFKQKKAGMNGLDREIVIDYVRKLFATRDIELRKKITEIKRTHEEYDKGAHDYKEGWNAALDDVLSLLDNPQKV